MLERRIGSERLNDCVRFRGWEGRSWEAKPVPGACLPRGVGIWGEFPGPSSVELSSLLVRNVNYEIPSLKKQIAKCQQLQQEYSRKEEEGQAGAAEMREQFYHSCKQYGVTVSLWGPEPSSSISGTPLRTTPVSGLLFHPL